LGGFWSAIASLRQLTVSTSLPRNQRFAILSLSPLDKNTL